MKLHKASRSHPCYTQSSIQKTVSRFSH